LGDQDVAIVGMHRLQPDHVVVAHGEDRARHHRAAARPLGHFEGHLVAKRLARLVMIDRKECTLRSVSTSRNSDWARCSMRAVRTVSSKTASPVLFSMSATRIFSRSALGGDFTLAGSGVGVAAGCAVNRSLSMSPRTGAVKR